MIYDLLINNKIFDVELSMLRKTRLNIHKKVDQMQIVAIIYLVELRSFDIDSDAKMVKCFIQIVPWNSSIDPINQIP